MFSSFPMSWYPLCRSTEVKRGRVIARQAFGIPFAVFRTESGRVGALHAECAHMGADLASGQVVGEHVQCPLHHWEYSQGGQCEGIPGYAAIPARARQAAFTCEEHYGLVYVFLGGEPLFEFPRFQDEDAALYSRAYSMDFDTPYQVLASNSFDGQHFSTVHRRVLLEPAQLTSISPYHLAIHFKARVEGSHFHDRLLRGLGIKTVELRAHCWGGNLILAYNARTSSYIMFNVLPLAAEKTRVFILNVMSAHGARALPRFLRRALLEISHALTIAFLKPDIAVMRQLRFKLGILLPDTDRCFIEWVKYWKALPRASALTSHAQPEVV